MTILATQKQQRKVGRKKALIYFEQVKNKENYLMMQRGRKLISHPPPQGWGFASKVKGGTSPCQSYWRRKNILLRSNGVRIGVVLVSSMSLGKILEVFRKTNPGGWRALQKTSRLKSEEIISAVLETANEMRTK